jgi:hypothetical protein
MLVVHMNMSLIVLLVQVSGAYRDNREDSPQS